MFDVKNIGMVNVHLADFLQALFLIVLSEEVLGKSHIP